MEGIRVMRESFVTPPCTNACPAGVDVSRYLRCIKEGDFDESLAVIREKIPLPTVCADACFNPCEDSCAYKQFGDPVAIRALKRAAVDNGGNLWKRNKKVAAKTGKKIAIIGSGPAGLTASYYLATLGHKVVMYDSFPKPGGMMRYGIPRYRLTEDRLERDIKEILDLGVEFQPDTTIGQEILLREIQEEFDAIFLATGANASRRIDLDGLDKSGVFWGLDFLGAVAKGEKIGFQGDVVVVGGGNVAIDVALTVKRLGADKVSLVCLEKREEMPAHHWEISRAEEEGVAIYNSWGPKIILGDGSVTGAEFIQCTAVFDKSGNFNPVYNEKITNTIQAQNIVLAIGQSSVIDFLNEKTTAIITERGLVKVEEDGLATGEPGVFAGGDIVSGPASIIDAIGHGKKGAILIDKYLGGQGIIDEELATPEDEVVIPESIKKVKARARMPLLGLKERLISFEQVERGLNRQQAIEEAKRCLDCDAREFEVAVYIENCKECGYCMEVCGLEIFVPASEFNKKGYRPVEPKNSEKCVGCLRCFYACPDYAIDIRELRAQDRGGI
jgi:formate dehydrogenase beta subunit